MVANKELLAATVTPERPHLLETCSLLAATLLYRHRPHLVLFLSRHVESSRSFQLAALLTEPTYSLDTASSVVALLAAYLFPVVVERSLRFGFSGGFTFSTSAITPLNGKGM